MTSRAVPGPYPPGEMDRFLQSFLYQPEGFLVDEVLRMDSAAGEIDARLDTGRNLVLSELQRVGENHPAHVSAGELLQATGSLGCLHAWFFHGCRWDEGWGGFGTRIHRAEFRRLVRRGPPLLMRSREVRSRVGPRRVVLRCIFDFEQEGERVYHGDQAAFFVRDQPL